VVARCEETVEVAEEEGQPEIAFLIEGAGRFLLGRLMGGRRGLDDSAAPRITGRW